MDMVRQVVVFDAADVEAESMFWAGIFDGSVFGDESFRCVLDASGEWLALLTSTFVLRVIALAGI